MENKEIRRINLKQLVEESGSIVNFATKSEIPEAYISQIINKAPAGKSKTPRGMGSATARKIEIRCGKPFGWMDNLHDESGGEYVYIKNPLLLRLLQVAEKAPPEVVAEHTRGIDSTTQLINNAKKESTN
jgi:hypothetical protein